MNTWQKVSIEGNPFIIRFKTPNKIGGKVYGLRVLKVIHL